MTGSLLDVQAENFRRSPLGADDDRFWRSFLHFFELTVPNSALGLVGERTTSMLFPLIINPESYAVSDPFTVTATPTLDGGLFVEENGIVARSIRIDGHTGFKTRQFPGAGLGISSLVKTDNFSFKVRGKATPLAVSGQRHFEFLQDRVFRTYGELKRDPATARETVMRYHNVKDDEHWHVIPIRFDLKRGNRERVIYRYSIELLAVDKAAVAPLPAVTEDKNWLDQAKDAISAVRNTLGQINAAIADLGEFIDDISKIATGAIEMFAAVVDAANALTSFVTGAIDFIARPIGAFADLVDGIANVADQVAAIPSAYRDVVVNRFRQLENSFDHLLQHPEVFADPVRLRVASLNAKRTLSTAVSSAAVSNAVANPPTTLRGLGKLGTAPSPGDQFRVKDSNPQTRNVTYTSAFQYQVGAGDSLQALAAKFLGDSREWRSIAVLNNLTAPYISDTPLPGVVRQGDQILIPSTSRATNAEANAGIIGTRIEDPLPTQLFGTDFRMDAVAAGPLYDRVIDPSSGGTDVLHVSGIENLQQGIRTRMITEQGTVPLYKDLGHRRLVGLGIKAIDDEVIDLRLSEAVSADPRILRVDGVRRNDTLSPDILDVEVDAIVRGLGQPVTVQSYVPAPGNGA